MTWSKAGESHPLLPSCAMDEMVRNSYHQIKCTSHHCIMFIPSDPDALLHLINCDREKAAHGSAAALITIFTVGFSMM